MAAAEESSSSTGKNKGDSYRRVWDEDEFQKKAKDRLLEEEEEEILSGLKDDIPVQRELLKARDYHVDLDSKLGKSVVITKTTALADQGGYFCNVCDCIVKDSINFLDHVNGKKHQRNLGMSMKVERSSLDQVKKRFELNKRKREEKDKKVEYDFEARMKELQEEEEKKKQFKKDAKIERKRKATDNIDDDVDPAIAEMMGFGGFGSSKK